MYCMSYMHAHRKHTARRSSSSEIRQLLYTRVLTGREKVRVPGHDGPWSPLSSLDAFTDIFALLDIQTTQGGRIQGWRVQRAQSAPEEGAAVISEALPQPDEDEFDDEEITETSEVPASRRGLVLGAVAVVAVVLLLLVAALSVLG